MGLLSGLFGSKVKKEPQKQLPWHLLENETQLEEIEAISKEKLVVIFKHSSRCGTSRMALRGFEQGFDFALKDRVQLYGIEVLNKRNMSNRVAEKYRVFHESPQLILIKDNKVVDHFSHYHVTAEVLQKYV